MASVQDIVECPQCGRKAFLEFHTRRLEESILCACCGYRESTRPLIDRQRQSQDPENSAWFKRRKNGELIFRTTRRLGQGAYVLAQKNGMSMLGVVNCKLTRKLITNFKRDVARSEMDAQCSFLTRWNSKRRCVETVVGQIPSDFP